MTVTQAKALYATKWWEYCKPQQIVGFQLFEQKLCMPVVPNLYAALHELLGRSVFTHELGDGSALDAEVLEKTSKLSFEELLSLLPEEKREAVLAA